ncbi:MAG: hypothetical protein HZA50_11455 [Planctomycetes bacterium]|nr:hypothetical protein [Planctomycetota bacterium]
MNSDSGYNLNRPSLHGDVPGLGRILPHMDRPKKKEQQGQQKKRKSAKSSQGQQQDEQEQLLEGQDQANAAGQTEIQDEGGAGPAGGLDDDGDKHSIDYKV